MKQSKEQDILDAIKLADKEISEWKVFKKRCEKELEELRKCN